ncbi:MAG: response regulator transcription factor [Candidatus Geothermincolia bacterium]
MNAKILVVDDEKKLVALIRTYLEKEGYRVITTYDGQAALELWKSEAPDLIVLDILLPQLDGYDFCRRVRERAATPIIMLSAKSEEADKLVGLELGADDYMTKPFSLRELTARIKAVLRRGNGIEQGAEPMQRGVLLIRPAEHVVEVDGVTVSLTATEFRMLELMARRNGQVFNRQQLLEYASGEAFEAYERSVDVHIKNIRRKLREQTGEWEFIHTVHGVGYRFQPQRL